MQWQVGLTMRDSIGKMVTAANSRRGAGLSVGDHAKVWSELGELGMATQAAVRGLMAESVVALGRQEDLWRKVIGGLNASFVVTVDARQSTAETQLVLQRELARDRRPARELAAEGGPNVVLRAVRQAAEDVQAFNTVPYHERSHDGPGYHVTVGAMCDSLRELAAFCDAEGAAVAAVWSGFGVRRRGTRIRTAMEATGSQWRRAAAVLDKAMHECADDWLFPGDRPHGARLA